MHFIFIKICTFQFETFKHFSIFLFILGKGREPVIRCNFRECRQQASIRTNTYFANSAVPISKVIMVLVGWILKYSHQTLIRETGLCSNTVSKLVTQFRDLLCTWLVETSTKIGGRGKIVEVDESAFGRRKYNRGRVTKTRWVVGGLERDTKKCFLKIVSQRDQNTLLDVVSEFVENGTTIITDCWKGYNRLSVSGFEHKTVNHSYNFVSPENRLIHTQSIESHWSKLKRDMRRRVGRMSTNNFEIYLVEYTWRSLHNTNEELFEDIIKAINYFYPV